MGDREGVKYAREDGHYQGPKHVAVPYVENTLYSTNKYIYIRPVHTLYIGYRQCMFKSNIEARSRNHICRGKAESITYSECVSVALLIQNAKPMHRIVFYQ